MPTGYYSLISRLWLHFPVKKSLREALWKLLRKR
jgi:hypothetical protein